MPCPLTQSPWSSVSVDESLLERVFAKLSELAIKSVTRKFEALVF